MDDLFHTPAKPFLPMQYSILLEDQLDALRVLRKNVIDPHVTFTEDTVGHYMLPCRLKIKENKIAGWGTSDGYNWTVDQWMEKINGI